MSAEPAQNASISAGTTPGKVALGPLPDKTWKPGRLLTAIEKVIQGDFQRPGHPLQCCTGRNSMTVFNTGVRITRYLSLVDPLSQRSIKTRQEPLMSKG